MGNKIFIAVVTLLWGATMSWLLVAKILPPFFNGDPPSTGSVLNKQAVAWSIEVEGDRVGYAVSQSVPGALDATEIHSRVSISNIPLKQIAPHWMANLVQNIGDIQLDMRTRTTIDPLGNLASFDTKIQVNDLPSAIRMLGNVHGDSLQIKLQAGEFKRRFEYPWPKDTWLGRELTPDAKLLRVYVGRRWQHDVYSPFSAPQNPIEVVEAEVVEENPILHQGRLVNARRVEYRSLSGAGIAADNRLRSIVWVADDGTVLRQDAHFMNVRLRFERLDDTQANELAADQLNLDVEASVAPSKN
jgi:hypothetical protein